MRLRPAGKGKQAELQGGKDEGIEEAGEVRLKKGVTGEMPVTTRLSWSDGLTVRCP